MTRVTVYTTDQARRDLDAVLREATTLGEARIRSADGRKFSLQPIPVPPPERDQRLCAEPQRDLSDLAGAWVEDPAFDEAMREMDRIHPDDWK